MSGLRIAFFGSSLVSAYWNGAATYYRGVLRALALRGHRITFYEPDAYDRQRHRDIDDPLWARVVVYPPEVDAASRCLEEASGADLVVKASGVGVLDAELEAGVAALRTARRLTAFWDVDAPATLDRLRADPTDPFRRLVPSFDIVFTYGGGDPVVRAYRELGARACAPIYNALDPETHFPAPPEGRFLSDLVLLGNRLPDREQRIEELFFSVAARPHLAGRRFLLGGNGWTDRTGRDRVGSNVHYLGHVYTRDHNALNSSALTVLNVHRESMVRNGWSPATRLFEAAGAAACQITDAWAGIEAFLEPRREVLIARDGDEVAEHLLALTPLEARRIGTAARRRILAHHTYSHRAAAVEAQLDALSPPPFREANA